MIVIIDTDILSMFAKVDEIDLLLALFNQKIFITPKVRDEISAPLEYGYNFPLRAISKIQAVPLNESMLRLSERPQENLVLGKGEVESIAYCKVAGCIFATNDTKAREFAKAQGVLVISLQAILRALIRKNLRSKEETREILEKIKEADNLVLTRKTIDEIFA